MLPNGITPWVFPRKMLLPTVDAWNATVQRQITPTLSVEVGYVGNKGTHVQTGENNWLDINAATTVGYCNSANPASPTTGCLSYNQRQPYFDKYGWTQLLRCVCDPGDNHYNSLQVKAEQRPWNTTLMSGLGFNVGYAECGLDTDSGVCFLNKVGNTGVSNQNQYHWFAVSPVPLAANGQTSGPWQRPAFGTFGDSGRNTLLGPKWFDSDLSVIKSFPVREQMRLQFRAELYNVFNHANLGNPNSCVDCGGAGTITNLANNASMRKMQFALRFEF
jgi:hypothetical protein